MHRQRIEPYHPLLHGDVLAYLSRKADSFEPGQFYGVGYFRMLSEMGLLIEDETQIEVFTGTNEREAYFVTGEHLLDAIVLDARGNVTSTMRISDPAETLADRVWTAVPIALDVGPLPANRVLS